jgi:multidrug efflux pump subunit AcrA (membrane-fusion protein)
MALDDAQEAALRGELSTAQSELNNTRTALAAANREGGGHRLNADRANAAANEAKLALDAARAEALAALDSARTDLTAKAEAAEARAAEARVSADQRTIQAELRTAAVLAGMIKPDLVKMLDISGVKLGEDGKVIIPETLFEDAKKSDPYMFGNAAAPNHSSNPNPPPKTAPSGDKKYGEMTPVEQQAFRDQHKIRG